MLGLILSLNGTQDAIANGDTRTLDLYHTHTRESLRVTFRRDGVFDNAALEKLNWFLRDWRIDEPTTMAPDLFDIVWYTAREAGGTEPIRIVSAYRSPGTNAMLARRSRAVAKNSQHMRGNAMDFHVPGVSMAKVREIGMRLQRGGVGYYPTAGTPFVHLDVGSVRSWPRMPRDQLERLFPDGKTVHIPADGVPLANYEAALAEVQARGGSALDFATITTRGKSFWALLFGGGEEDEDADSSRSAPASAAGVRVAAGSVPSPEPTGETNPMKVTAYTPQSAESAPYAAPRIAATTLSPAPPAFSGTLPPKLEDTARQLVLDAPFPPAKPKGGDLQTMLAAIAPLAVPLPPIRPTTFGGVNAGLPPLPDMTSASPQIVTGMPAPPSRATILAYTASASTTPASLAPVPPTLRGVSQPAAASAPVPVSAGRSAPPVLDRVALAVAALRAARAREMSVSSGQFGASRAGSAPDSLVKAPTAFLDPAHPVP